MPHIPEQFSRTYRWKEWLYLINDCHPLRILYIKRDTEINSSVDINNYIEPRHCYNIIFLRIWLAYAKQLNHNIDMTCITNFRIYICIYICIYKCHYTIISLFLCFDWLRMCPDNIHLFCFPKTETLARVKYMIFEFMYVYTCIHE